MAGLSSGISQSQIIDNLKLCLANNTIKNGTVLFFGRQPEDFIEKASLRCLAYEGTTKTNIVDDKPFMGALMLQYRHCMQWLKGKLDVGYLITDGGPRKEIWEIPEVALKEAIINALSHRDYYDKGGVILVELYTDRLEVTNPGGLSSAIPISDFGTKSHSRNPLIFGLFERINMVEQIGSGIARMKDALTSANLPEPKFNFDGMFTVIFSRKKSSGKSSGKSSEENLKMVIQQLKSKSDTKLGKSALSILEMIYKNNQITIPEMANKIGITERAIEKNIKKLREDGLLSREDGDRKGWWRLNI